MKPLGCVLLVIAVGALAPGAEAADVNINEARSALGLPEAEKLPDEELAPLLEEWDALVSSSERDATGAVGLVSVMAGKDTDYPGVRVLQYGNAEVVERVVDLLAMKLDREALARQREDDPGWFRLSDEGRGEYLTHLTQVALSSFHPALLDYVLPCHEQPERYRSAEGHLRLPYLAAVAPDTVIQMLLEAEFEARDLETRRLWRFLCDSEDGVLLSLHDAFAFLEYAARLSPQSVQHRREDVVAFVENFALLPLDPASPSLHRIRHRAMTILKVAGSAAEADLIRRLAEEGVGEQTEPVVRTHGLLSDRADSVLAHLLDP